MSHPSHHAPVVLSLALLCLSLSGCHTADTPRDPERATASTAQPALRSDEPVSPASPAPSTCYTGSCERPEATTSAHRNILRDALAPCSMDPLTGWFRDGYCRTDDADGGVHVVCAQVTSDFLAYTKSQGNDLSSPTGSFPGLEPGDRWCLCASRWREAHEAGKAPGVVPEATHIKALQLIDLETLQGAAAP